MGAVDFSRFLLRMMMDESPSISTEVSIHLVRSHPSPRALDLLSRTACLSQLRWGDDAAGALTAPAAGPSIPTRSLRLLVYFRLREIGPSQGPERETARTRHGLTPTDVVDEDAFIVGIRVDGDCKASICLDVVLNSNHLPSRLRSSMSNPEVSRMVWDPQEIWITSSSSHNVSVMNKERWIVLA